MNRFTWTEQTVGSFTVIVRKTRHRHYSARVYRGRALSAVLIGLASIDGFIRNAQ